MRGHDLAGCGWLRALIWGLGLGLGLGVGAAELAWDFGQTKAGLQPEGFRSTVSGEGAPGTWQVLEVVQDLAATNALLQSSVVAREAVLAQVARDATDEHFPLLIWEGETFGDFTFTAQVKAVEGTAEQMAGLAFRIQDETNYYVLRLSALGGTVRFYKFVNGVRTPPLGPELKVERGVWHELSVSCKANQIRCSYDGKELFPPLEDNSFMSGKLGFWTKSDSVSHFRNARVVYTPQVSLAKRLVKRAMTDHERLLGVRIAGVDTEGGPVRILASSEAGEVGQLAGEYEEACVRRGTPYYGKDKGEVRVLLPLRDRNGEPVASVRVLLRPVLGQNQDGALSRARPIVAAMQAQVRAQRDLVE